jgi:hypothetical protein
MGVALDFAPGVTDGFGDGFVPLAGPGACACREDSGVVVEVEAENSPL